MTQLRYAPLLGELAPALMALFSVVVNTARRASLAGQSGDDSTPSVISGVARLLRVTMAWHHVVMPNPRRLIAWLVVGASAVSLVGCVPSTPVSPDLAWSSRMVGLLSAPNGQGGAGGEVSAQKRKGSVTLMSVTAGSYDVLAVCTGMDTVHFIVSSNSEAGNGSSPDGVLASADIACGATLRLPVTIPAGGVALTASSAGGSGAWQSSIVTPGWSPVPTTFSH